MIETANQHQAPTRCVWLDTPLAQAQVNLVERMLDRFGSLPTPEELKELARREPGVLAPTSQMRALRELEPPSSDEGLSAVEQIPFVRTPSPKRARAGVFVAAAAARHPKLEQVLELGDSGAPHLLFDWSPDGTLDDLAARLAARISGPIETALCTHAAGPPTCWCRPPLAGLPLTFARSHGVNPSTSIVIGTGPAHRTLANALGAQYIQV